MRQANEGIIFCADMDSLPICVEMFFVSFHTARYINSDCQKSIIQTVLKKKVLYLQMSQINLKYLVCLANTGLEPLLPLEL